MRVVDYVTDFIYKAGGKTVFLVTGGYSLPLTDALKIHPRQKYVCCLHEQAAAMAAEGYARMTGGIGAGYFTAGPAVTNAVTGVAGAFFDSAPCLFVSGQQKLSYVKVDKPRQYGFQGFVSLPLMKTITKYAVLIENTEMVRYELEKSLFIAKSGRPGPVWIEIPLDIQGMPYDPQKHKGFVPPKVLKKGNAGPLIKKAANLIRKSARPVFFAGAGVAISKAENELRSLVRQTRIPLLTSRGGMDLIDDKDPLYAGRPGLYGSRGANFAVENADLFISIGSRLNILHVGHNFKTFARRAKKIIVDIDPEELDKPSFDPVLKIQSDAKEFLEGLLDELKDFRFESREWMPAIRQWKKNYPVVLPEYSDDRKGINTYYFFDRFSEFAPKDANFVLDACSAYYTFPQAFRVKHGQRHIITGGLGTMGYMPASIGAAFARPGKDIYCITGDGSIQMNLQELQTIVFHKLPVKMIVLNNSGYLCIKLTQNNLFDSRRIGSDEEGGLSLPDMEKISRAYGIRYIRAEKISELDKRIKEMVEFKGPVIFDLFMPRDQKIIPRIMSAKREDGSMMSMEYDDLYPFLPREEYQKNHDYFLGR